MALDLFFLGAEEAGWRRLLLDQEATCIAYGFSNLKRRSPKMKLRQREGVKQLLDSGGRAADKNPGRRTIEQWMLYEENYFEFVSANIEALDYVIEFDAQILGVEHVLEMRERIWNTIPEEKFIPVWYPHEDLDELARSYVNLAIPDKLLTPLVARKLHHLPVNAFGIQANPESCRFLKGNVSSAWLGPSQYGETVVWDGQLRTYPKKEMDQARKRHRVNIGRAGFDAEKVENSDPIEVTKLAVWSWLRFAEKLGEVHPPAAGEPRVVQPPVVQAEAYESLEDALVSQPRVPLPIMRANGEISGRTLRVCNSCHLSGRCPAYRPDESCAYEIPLKVQSRGDLVTLLQGIIEMQGQRVVFARFVEEIEGGYADEALSAEMDRLLRVITAAKDIQANSDFLKVQIEGKSADGIMSKIFGKGAMNDGPPALEQGA